MLHSSSSRNAQLLICPFSPVLCLWGNIQIIDFFFFLFFYCLVRLYCFCFSLVPACPVLTAVPLSIQNWESPCDCTKRVCPNPLIERRMKQARVRGCWSVYSPSLPPILGRAESHPLTRLHSVTHLSHIAPSCVQSLCVRAYRGVTTRRRQPWPVCVKRRSGPRPLLSHSQTFIVVGCFLPILSANLENRFIFFLDVSWSRWLQDGLHSHLFTSRNALCSLKQWDQSPSFSQVFKEVEAQCWKEPDISFCLSRLVMSRVVLKQCPFVLAQIHLI